MPVTPDEFRSAMSRFPSGVTVVTSRAESGEQYGITVSAFCSVSLRPPLILVSIEKGVASHQALHESDAFVVNILGQGQDDISQHFALPSPVEFENMRTRPGIDGIPVLEDALASLECRLRHAYEGGDHTIFVGEVESVTIRDGSPLVYFHGNYRDLLDT
ncbi:MAG TPA: flavin reductase family protein [Pyrinomonadaceae bacterium]|nr:flavin reductase family protein [Pyrinomonadaceae bacterium]